MQENAKLKPALIGGVSLGVASAIPILNLLNCACCALVIGGGVLGAYLYTKDMPPSPQAPYGDGALVGLMAGVVGAIVSSILQIPLTLLTAGVGLAPGLDQVFEQMDLPEEAQEILSGIGAGGLSLTVMLIGFVTSLFIYSIFATVGGVIGVAVFSKKTPEGQPV